MPPGDLINSLTWAHLAPLFKGTWQGTDRVWLVLHPLLPAIGRVCQGLLRRRAASPRYDGPEELVQAVLVLSVRRLHESSGMNPPANRDAKTARGFFLNYIKTCALDCLKPLKSDEERPVQPALGGSVSAEQQLDRLASRSPSTPRQSTVGARVDAYRGLATVRSVVEGTQVNPRHRVVWICLRVPEWLEPRHVTLAVDGSGESDGLSRGEPDLVTGLMAWREQVVDPGSRPARRRLAWLLFTDDTSDPETWARRIPADARRARDRLRQWDGRFHRAHIVPLLAELEVNQ